MLVINDIITVYPSAYRVFFSRPPAAYRVFFSRPYIRPPIACVRSFTCVRVRSLKSHNMGTDADVHARTHTYGHGRRRTCTYEDGRGRCIHIIKSPDASARIISDTSGRVFRSRTFEVYYMYNYMCVIWNTDVGRVLKYSTLQSGLHLEIDPRGSEMSIYEKEGG